MMTPLVSSFGDLASRFSSAFSTPSLAYFLTMLTGWVFCLGRHIWGAGMPDGPYLMRIWPFGHHAPLRSTPTRPVFSFGHSSPWRCSQSSPNG